MFVAIAHVNRQINVLLEKQFSPREVFQKTTLATNYAASLLAGFPSVDRRPRNTPYERRKAPQDVYRKLLLVLDGVTAVAENSGLKALDFYMPEEVIANAVPSDVFQLASLIVSELSYIHSKSDYAAPVVAAYYPGNKFPSHVYQRVGMLEQQVNSLISISEQSGDWLVDGRLPTDRD